MRTAVVASDPTDGFTAQPLNASDYAIFTPSDLPICARYLFLNGVHTFGLISTDDCYGLLYSRNCKLRSQIRIQEYGYCRGVWQFEGHMYVPAGRTGMSVMSIGAPGRDTESLSLKVDGGSLRYREAVVADHVYDRWVRVNVIHKPRTRKARIFIDGNLTNEVKLAHPRWAAHVFQFGVNWEPNNSFYMESRWQNISVLKKT